MSTYSFCTQQVEWKWFDGVSESNRLSFSDFNSLSDLLVSFVNSWVTLYELRKSSWQAITGETSLFIDIAAGCLIDTSCYLTAVHLSFYCPGRLT